MPDNIAVHAPKIGVLAPEWYAKAIKSEMPRPKLFDLVRRFCLQSMPPEAVDDDFVQLMMDSYEA